MEVDKRYIYPDVELDRDEGKVIKTLSEKSQKTISDPDAWLDKELQRNILLTTVDGILNWSRRSSLWTVICFPACCAFEFIGAASPRFDISRFGMEIIRASTLKMAPQVKRIYDQMAEPKWVIAMGACAISGGLFNGSYSVMPGYNHIFPVDVYIPGCPPRPETLLYGIEMLRKKIAKRSIVNKDE
jgi:NADH-quinone oxidoreductase subunit B